MNTGQIINPTISIKPSRELVDYIKSIRVNLDLPEGIAKIISNKNNFSNFKAFEPKSLLTDEDRNYLKTLNLNSKQSFFNYPLDCKKTAPAKNEKFLLKLQDLHWLYEYIQNNNESPKIYLHELLKNSEIILPKNEQIPRNPELEKRCKQLKVSQQNKEYNNMTKNVDSIRRKHPEDTIAYQINQINRHLIVIAQFILSVIAGFAFGFIGVELIIGNLDFGFRLLLGIICSLVIALAELYFLAKKLNEDEQFDNMLNEKPKNVKID